MSSFRIVLVLLVSLTTFLLQANPVITPLSTVSRITLLFNQPKYAPGDTAFFAAQLYNEKVMLAEGRQVVTFKINGKGGITHIVKRISFLQGTGVGQFIIPETMEPGIYTLTAYEESFTSNTNPEILSAQFSVAGKFNFTLRKKDSPVIDMPNEFIALEVSQDTVHTRREVLCSIRLTNNALTTSFKNYTVAVFRKNLFTNATGELTNHIIHMVPERSTQNTLAKSDDPGKYYFRGKAILKSTGLPVQDSTLITFYLNAYDIIYGVYTRKDGSFTFPMFQDFNDQEVFYTLSYKKRVLTDGQVILENFPVTDVPEKAALSEVPDAYTDYWLYKKTILSSYKYYSSKKTGPTTAASENWVDSDIEIELKKFEPFASVSDMFINIVPMARYRKTKDIESIRVFLDKDAIYGERDPVFILDGVMTDNLPYILSIKPGAIKRIGVIRTESMLARFGDLGINGIIVIETTIPNHETLWERTQNSLFIKGIDKLLPITGKVYTPETFASRIPDLRACLYWNPHIPITSQSTGFNFFTSDDTGEFVIQVSVLMNNGNMIHMNKTITVIPPGL